MVSQVMIMDFIVDFYLCFFLIEMSYLLIILLNSLIIYFISNLIYINFLNCNNIHQFNVLTLLFGYYFLKNRVILQFKVEIISNFYNYSNYKIK
jgi:hypothetical protein